jgi:hypothetical protein
MVVVLLAALLGSLDLNGASGEIEGAAEEHVVAPKSLRYILEKTA